jgi:cytochrome P450
MLTTEGVQHQRYRRAVQADFSGPRIRAAQEAGLVSLAAQLLDGIHGLGTAELRSTFAARLPIQAILCLCGLPIEAEPNFRRWYNRFERALANFTDDPRIRQEASVAIEEFHVFLQAAIDAHSADSIPSLLKTLVNAAGTDRLTDEEIKRNLSIIFFGGISTVEALILNCLWALHENPDVLRAVKSDPARAIDVVEETIRWRSPVQSATRHATRRLQLRGATIEAGDVVNCMLGAANRDPEVFNLPGRFVIRRENIRKHLGFAMGPHSCLGFHLAKLEARIAIELLLDRLPEFRVVDHASEPPSGYEFHQPRRLQAAWTT